MYRAAAIANPKDVVNQSDAALGREYQRGAAVKFYIKALEEEAYRRLNHGHEVPGTKLVYKKANRVFKENADVLFKTHFGDEAFTVPELKSPAEMEKIGATAKTLVHEWAYTPKAGLTVALATDKRLGVKVQTTIEAFPSAEKFAVDTTNEVG
jgi:hypothetical protein